MMRRGILASMGPTSFLWGLFLIATLSFIGVVPASFGGSAAGAATIDAAMPATIPPEIVADWELRDNVASVGYAGATKSIISALPPAYASKAVQGTTKEAYLAAAHLQRVAQMEPVAPQIQQILYDKHYDLGGSIIGNIEDLKGDGYSSPCTGAKFNLPGMSRGSNFKSGSALLICNMTNYYGTPTTLLSDAGGVMRDPCLSYDGKKVAFAWSKDNDGYHIWEVDIATKATRQLTDDPATNLKVSDFEPCYTPDGQIIFNSSRVFGTVDCNFNIVSNLFIMDTAGRYLRRVGFDQVHTTYPTMMSNGKVLYSRWEYNDRNVSTVYGLFTMNTDASHQTEYYGNQTTTPNTLPQGREIPGSDGMVLAITGGHMGLYNGALCTIDPNVGRNGTASAKLICPSRAWTGGGMSMTGVPDDEKLFQNPYPLDKTRFLISYRTSKSAKFGIYLMSIDGATKQLIASDASMSVGSPIPLVARSLPPTPTYQANYSLKTAEVALTNAYYGIGTNPSTTSFSKVPQGSIKKIRVVALEYRVFPWFGNTGASAYTSTPLARWNGSWEAKRIVGEATVESDGSANMIVPARTPLYYQLLDADGCMIQTMRSWSTLQPGERFACYGCHEDKNIAPPPVINPIANKPKELDAFYGIKDEYFSFPRYIQPLLDKHCTSCHSGSSPDGSLDLSGTTFWTGTLTNDNDNKTACKNWSNAYYNLTAGIAGFTTKGKYVNIGGFDVNARAEGLTPNSTGSSKSALITKLKGGHVQGLPKEVIEKLAAFIDLAICYSGYYTEGMKPSDSTAYEERWKKTLGVERAVEDKNIQNFIAAGGYPGVGIANPGSKGSGSSLFYNEGLFKVRFSLDGRKLIANVPSEGTLTLMDLCGRQIMVCNLSRDAVKNGASVTLRGAGLTRGLYIVKFSGASVSGQRAITVL
jgi:hypothetical protein